ncbi:hypothetical protein HK097_002954 [Rhizophlyctis rosea]|uniref:N-terminal Ras-GEF domain-containing protein n=1 Tax=Rhizophlyctis rosea TaxID=64517 RepID=A0AAD5S333_9FUNG|nr:hypothetical protein HK097_002954 [Rhizophlyctis rosea]
MNDEFGGVGVDMHATPGAGAASVVSAESEGSISGRDSEGDGLQSLSVIPNAAGVASEEDDDIGPESPVEPTEWQTNRTFRIAIVGVAGGVDARGVLKTLAAVPAEDGDKRSSLSQIPLAAYTLHAAKTTLDSTEYDLQFLKFEEDASPKSLEYLPKVIAQSHGILVCYDVGDSESVVALPALLDAFSDSQLPTCLLGWQLKAEGERQVEKDLGSRLANVFGANFLEVLNPQEEADRVREFINGLSKVMVKRRELAHFRKQMLPKAQRYEHLKAQLRQLRRKHSTIGTEHGDDAADLGVLPVFPMPGLPQPRVQDDTVMYPMPNIGALKVDEEGADGEGSDGEKEEKGDGGNNSATPSPPSVTASAKTDLSPSTKPSLPTTTPQDLRHSISSASSTESTASSPPEIVVIDDDAPLATVPKAEPHSSLNRRGRRLSRLPDILDLSPDGFTVDSILEEYNHGVGRGERRVSSAFSDTSVLSGASASSSPATCPTSFTIDELIERLTSAECHDMEFTKVFLMLYRKFMRPSELLDRLMDRFDAFNRADQENRGGPINAVQLRVCNVLIHWCTEYWCDFHSDKMRFTLQIFLDLCSSRPAFTAVTQKLAQLVYREPPTEAEKEGIDWGIPDVDDDEDLRSIRSSIVGSDGVGEKGDDKDRRASRDSAIYQNYYAANMSRKQSFASMASSASGGDGGIGNGVGAAFDAVNRRSATSTATSTSLSSLSDSLSGSTVSYKHQTLQTKSRE